MSDHEPEPENFEEKVRALAHELAEQLERTAEEFDLETIADRIGTTGDRIRELADFAGQFLTGIQHRGDPSAPGGSGSGDRGAPGERTAGGPWSAGPDAGDDLNRVTGPHPLDMPTNDQGLALSALDSGRWKVQPGTVELIAGDDGPGPSDPLGLVSELRARDWINADGEVTLVGRDAMRRWVERSRPA